ncbi:uncharacterized protein LOC130986923 [Salvia miltiorrhiza]|uniref:uncharacterized protein LOC130986923 n=1 Tax=Salvia miltiorrhiza TaxID=226208 RepID=UPI0025AD9B2C|nr:uncharacterized protein LOC130986923 [Salvia miltiorrhiza]
MSQLLPSQDLATKKIIGGGHESDGLYILDSEQASSVAYTETVTPMEAYTGTVTPMEAHYRLGHPSLSSLNKFDFLIYTVTSPIVSPSDSARPLIIHTYSRRLSPSVPATSELVPMHLHCVPFNQYLKRQILL